MDALFHTMISWQLSTLILVFVLSYIFAFIFFGVAIYVQDQFAEVAMFHDQELNLLEAVFFTGFTMCTVGYGDNYPRNESASLIPTASVLAGILLHAFWIGLIVCRLSDPRTLTHTILFSNRAVIRHPSELCQSSEPSRLFECRLINLRTGASWVEARIYMYYVSWKSGRPVFRELTVLNENVPPFMDLPWSVSHVISPESPLYRLSVQQIAAERGEVVVEVEGLCPLTGNGMKKRFSYIASELFPDHVFHDVLSLDSSNKFIVHLDDFHRTKECDMLTAGNDIGALTQSKTTKLIQS